MRFLLIEDNQALANAVTERLSLDSHIVDHAADLTTAWDYTATAEYDLILLDIMLPDGDGRSFLEQHRSAKSRTPVIVLTARSEVSDRVGILDLGADDYMVKPIDFSELEARCRAVLRRQTGAAQNTISFGEIEFDSLAATLKVNGTEVKLRTKELRLFEVFINAPNQIFPKSQLLDRLFPYDVEASENAIEVYVGRVRKHLSGSNVSITTVRGLGYKLECQ
jgi:DNA-binding response OmpR family regulator